VTPVVLIISVLFRTRSNFTRHPSSIVRHAH